MTRTTTACRMGRPSPPYFARLHSFSFDAYVINRCHRSAKRSIPNRQNTIRAIFNGSATYINRTSICTVFDSQCTIIINRAISACFRCRRINYAPPCYCQGTSVHNRPACKARRHGNTVALHVQDNILVFRNSDNLLRRHPGDITCQCNRSFLTIWCSFNCLLQSAVGSVIRLGRLSYRLHCCQLLLSFACKRQKCAGTLGILTVSHCPNIFKRARPRSPLMRCRGTVHIE